MPLRMYFGPKKSEYEFKEIRNIRWNTGFDTATLIQKANHFAATL
jgi:hypothetical protein